MCDDALYRKLARDAEPIITRQIRTAAYKSRPHSAQHRRDIRFWAGICAVEFAISAVALDHTPSDWNLYKRGNFRARLLTTESGFEIEYLNQGTDEQKIAYLLHELAESLLLARLPHCATPDAQTARHQSARRIEQTLLTECFNQPDPTSAKEGKIIIKSA